MIRDGAVLLFAAAQATVGGNAVFVVKISIVVLVTRTTLVYYKILT